MKERRPSSFDFWNIILLAGIFLVGANARGLRRVNRCTSAKLTSQENLMGDKTVQPEPAPVDGYSKLAELYGQKPEVAIFKRFGRLNAENLLFLQAELLLLEQELKEIIAEDLRSENEQVRLYARSFWAMEHYSQHGGDSLQWLKRIEIKKKLKEYSTLSTILVIALNLC